MVITTSSSKEGNFTYKADLYDNGQLKVIITRTLSRTQYRNDLNNECVKDEKDAQEKLREYIIKEAEAILKTIKNQDLPVKIIGPYSACGYK